MNAVSLIIRPELGRKAYRLRCRFTVPAFPHKDWLAKAKVAAAEAFVRDMRKQGFEYRDEHGFQMTGPFAPFRRESLPGRRNQARWHQASAEMFESVRAGYPPRAGDATYVASVPSLDATAEWDYELKGVFVHTTILTEMPEPHEIEKELAHR